jgi:Nucleotidyl transferase AbiEii toxin, Type IV TA system
MQDLQNLEIFEIEVLDLLNSSRILDKLYFGGGTMLRLCHNLNRYSTDLDFWLDTSTDSKSIYNTLKDVLSENYKLLDSANKRYTLVFEFRSDKVPRSLKIEIRKDRSEFEWERKIAFSRFSNKQVMVKGLTLDQMMKNKIEALLSRKIIRDCFDMEFLLMRGANLPEDKLKLENILKIITSFKARDFKVTLGSILETTDRDYYNQNGFRVLKEEITNALNKL